MSKKNLRAFTLIELLIVVAIIGILAVALVPRITGSTMTARDAARKADLQQISTALEMYYNSNGSYPGTPSTAQCVSSTTLGTTLASYISSVPTDPKSGGSSSQTISIGGAVACTNNYYYLPLGSSTSATSYVLIANLEDDTIYGTGKGYYSGASFTKPTTYPLGTGYTECTATSTCTDVYYVVGN